MKSSPKEKKALESETNDISNTIKVKPVIVGLNNRDRKSLREKVGLNVSKSRGPIQQPRTLSPPPNDLSNRKKWYYLSKQELIKAPIIIDGHKIPAEVNINNNNCYVWFQSKRINLGKVSSTFMLQLAGNISNYHYSNFIIILL